MAETTEQFLERFKATGLDMLCEARRRTEQAYPQYGVRTGRMSFKHPAFGWPYGQRSSVWKGASMGVSTPHQFIDLDFTDLERRVTESYVRPNWDQNPCRRVGQALDRLSAAFTLASVSLTSLGGWHSNFYEPVAEPYEPKERELWPGVKVQVEGERRVNAKRVAKDRLKKKLAKKRK